VFREAASRRARAEVEEAEREAAAEPAWASP